MNVEILAIDGERLVNLAVSREHLGTVVFESMSRILSDRLRRASEGMARDPRSSWYRVVPAAPPEREQPVEAQAAPHAQRTSPTSLPILDSPATRTLAQRARCAGR